MVDRRVDVPQIIEVKHIVPEIIRVNHYIEKIIDRIV
jgi:hypothetical protein